VRHVDSEPPDEQKVVRADFAILDSQFPQAEPRGFRNTEFCEFLRRYSNVTVFGMYEMPLGELAAHPHVLGVNRSQFRAKKAGFKSVHPEQCANIRWLNPAAGYEIGLAYSVFLAETYALLPFYETHGIPFIFTLFPGGLFALHNPHSDAMLHRVCGSPQFRGVIATQVITRDYLLAGGFCPESRITLVFGACVQFRPADVLPKEQFPTDKQTLDLCFVASKYSPQGYDKGYDLFVRTAQLLAERDYCFRFHVVGDFEPDDCPLGAAADRFHFYGPQMPAFLLRLYSRMDIFLSPNRPGALVPGNFDGFPLGGDPSSCGVTLLVADELGINTHYRDRSELIVIPLDPEAIAQEIVALKNDPALMYAIGASGRRRTEELYDLDVQVDARADLISQFVELRPRPQQPPPASMSARWKRLGRVVGR
jgi:glycosyltransferase involved in cell wall biosynthesis